MLKARNLFMSLHVVSKAKELRDWNHMSDVYEKRPCTLRYPTLNGPAAHQPHVISIPLRL